MNLDKVQKEIVNSEYDKILVVAASGSGKTRVITERVKALIERGENPQKIVAITFTNAAAVEMRERLGNIADEVFIGTIHSYANRLLVLDGIDTSSYLNDEKFDRLFDEVRKNLKTFPEVDHLLVDEFQDIDDDQFEFFQLLNPKNYFYIGDDYQNIYSWRGANIEHFFNLYYDDDTMIYTMSNNYRTPKEIIKFATSFISRVEDKIVKRVKCMNENGGLIQLKNLDKQFIYDYINGDKKYGEWFILTRTNAQVDQMMNFLNSKKIPCDTFKKSELDNSELKEKLKQNTVKVLTIHSAKGLENENIVVLGIKPFTDEERRVAYVAATRAKKLLIWVHSTKDPYTKKININNWE